jgi:hypothetical protein
MQESEFLKTFRRIHREYPNMFAVLEEYDRTRRLRKISYKQRANFTIDAVTLRQFRRYCKERGYSMSQLLEMFMRAKMKNI